MIETTLEDFFNLKSRVARPCSIFSTERIIEMIKTKTSYVFSDQDAKKPTWRVMFNGALQKETFTGANAKGKSMAHLAALQDGRIKISGGLEDGTVSSPIIRDVANPGELNEPELPDDYPVYADYLYVADGNVIRSNIGGEDISFLKKVGGYKKVQRCDIVGRGIGV